MNNNENKTQCVSQQKQIYDYMMQGNRITAYEALRLFGCLRLSARIADIKQHHPDVKVISDRLRTHNGKNVAQYYVQG